MYRVVLLTYCVIYTFARLDSSESECKIRAKTDAGWVCGTRREGDFGLLYASFRGVPYAKQPLGELRFKELQPAKPWEGLLDATREGPVCIQKDPLYKRLMQSSGMSEACIYANIHVPLADLPWYSQGRAARGVVPPHQTAFDELPTLSPGLPIVVFIHGGGFAFGSGDSDVYGPEYLVSKRVIVITFNYRLNVFGFLSLNTPSIPGNNGLRDMVTLLRWVQRNARAFGGDPDNVTLAGQSAGASAAHLLSLSPAAEGLFKRIWLMSGTGLPIFFPTSPAFAQAAAQNFLVAMNINSTDPEDIHQKLNEAFIEQIIEINEVLQDKFGLFTFTPVVESKHPGVTQILDDDPEVLVKKGRGKDIPLVVGFTDVECETFRLQFENMTIVSQIKEFPLITVPAQILYSKPLFISEDIAKEIQAKYFKETVSMDGMVKLCTEQYFMYPALRLANLRRTTGGAPVFLYEFSYDDANSVLKEGFDISYTGAAHIEDMTYIMKTNSIVAKENSPNEVMKDWMTKLFTNYMHTGNPNGDSHSLSSFWLPVKQHQIKYQPISNPGVAYSTGLTEELQHIKSFFDSIFDKALS